MSRIIAAGVLHPADVCAFCGARSGLVKTTIIATRASGMRCHDGGRCVRRQLVLRNQRWGLAA